MQTTTHTVAVKQLTLTTGFAANVTYYWLIAVSELARLLL